MNRPIINLDVIDEDSAFEAIEIVGFKDQEDAVFLLSRQDLVNRNLIKEHIIKTAGAIAWGLARHGY